MALVIRGILSQYLIFCLVLELQLCGIDPLILLNPSIPLNPLAEVGASAGRRGWLSEGGYIEVFIPRDDI